MGVYVCYCLLKNGTGSLRIVSRLRELQAYYEKAYEPELPQQAFVCGDAEAACLPFKAYPKGWRTGMDAGMESCRTQDLLALSWRLLESAMRGKRESVFKLIILADGPVRAEQESAVLTIGLLKELKEKGLEIVFACCSPEADSSLLEALAGRKIGAGEDTEAALGGS